MAIALGSELNPFCIDLRRELSEPDARSLRSSILAALSQGGQHVVVDCLGWERLDLVVLSALVQGAKACAAIGASFELINLTRELRSDIVALRLENRLGLAA